MNAQATAIVCHLFVGLVLPLGPLALGTPFDPVSDYWVDASQGSDVTGDGSQTAPWQTISYGLGQIPDPPVGQTHALHVAPGGYDAALGEVFPLTLRPRLQLIGEGGPNVTVLDGGGASVALVSMRSEQAGAGLQFARDTQVVGLTLERARYGVHVYSDWLPVSPTLADLVVREMKVGLFIQVDGFGGAGSADPLVERMTASANDLGLWAIQIGDGSARCELADSSLSENHVHGLLAEAAGGSCVITLERSRVEANRADGIRTGYTNWGGVTIDARGSSISGNGRAGYRGVVDEGLGGSAVGVFERCTLAYNGGAGVHAVQIPVMATHPTDLVNCIVWGNARDIEAGPPGFLPVDARYCDIGSGAFNDFGGNLALDPRHWAPEILDVHLRVDSACIDAGDPNSAPDADGSVADMGAFPFDASYAPQARAYCFAAPNSAGDGALLSASGSASIADNDFTLDATGCPPDKTALFYYGPAQIEVPFGDGARCVGGAGGGTFRLHPIQQSDAGGLLTRQVDFGAPPANAGSGAILAGSKWSFQLWYRDPLGPGGSGFNLSDGLSAWFLP